MRGKLGIMINALFCNNHRSVGGIVVIVIVVAAFIIGEEGVVVGKESGEIAGGYLYTNAMILFKHVASIL